MIIQNDIYIRSTSALVYAGLATIIRKDTIMQSEMPHARHTVIIILKIHKLD